MAPVPFKIVFRPNPDAPLQMLSNENDAGELTSTIFPRGIISATRRLLLSSSSPLSKRQSDSSIVPVNYSNQNSGPSPGTVVGIVLGSVAGFLLLLWLLYTCLSFNNVSSSSSYTESVVVRDRRKSTAGSHRSRRMSETVEIRRERSPVRIVREPMRTERVVVEERRESRRDHSPTTSDEVVVIEEHSPPRRSKSKKETVEVRRESGYRTVDPLSYAGGGAPLRGVAKGSRRSSGR